jgi:biopolymer transport protein ExbD
MRRRHSETESPAAAVNLTPLLDMVFILLIFFIVTSSFEREAGVQVNRPGAETAAQQEQGAISISIDDTGNVWMENQPIDPGAIRRRVERLRAEDPQRAVIIRADREASTGVLIGIVDQVRLAGVHNVSVAAEPRRGEFPRRGTGED